MEFKAGTVDIPIVVKMRLDGAVITRAAHQALYGTPSVIDYQLEFESADKTKTGTVSYNLAKSPADGIYFDIPASLLDTENIAYAVALKFTYDSVIDFGLYRFEVKVVKPTSINSR